MSFKFLNFPAHRTTNSAAVFRNWVTEGNHTKLKKRDIMYSFPSGKTFVTLQGNQLVSSEESKRGAHLLASSFSGQINNEDMSSFSGFQRLATIRMSEFVILALLCLMKCFVKNQLLAQTPRDLRTFLWLDGKLHVELFALLHLLCRRRAVCFNVCKISLYPPS